MEEDIKGKVFSMAKTWQTGGHPGRGKGVWIIGLIILGILGYFTIVVVPAGSVGVRDLFGKVSEEPIHPGIHMVNPLARVLIFSVRTQEVKEVVEIPTKEGLAVQVDVSLLFSLNPAKSPDVYKSLGFEYVNVVIIPQLRSVVRDTTSGFEAKALYTAERENITQKIQKTLEPILTQRGMVVEKVLLRKITLPAKVAMAIESKLEAEQQAEQMKFVLDRERQEAERKRIEAKGISDYQAIINTGLNQNILTWKGIEATKELAKSQNAKVVIIGSGKEGLPIILGNQ